MRPKSGALPTSSAPAWLQASSSPSFRSGINSLGSEVWNASQPPRWRVAAHLGGKEVTYRAPIIATLVSQEGTMGYTSVHSSEAELRPLLSGEQNISRCAPRSEHREEVAVVKVWMDVDGSGLECMETAGKATACTPAPTAPRPRTSSPCPPTAAWPRRSTSR